MLVLTRKAGQGILIGEDIELTVLDVRDGQVSIGIAAPDKVRILRNELEEKAVQGGKKGLKNEL